jgi:hypothetical protein
MQQFVKLAIGYLIILPFAHLVDFVERYDWKREAELLLMVIGGFGILLCVIGTFPWILPIGLAALFIGIARNS